MLLGIFYNSYKEDSKCQSFYRKDYNKVFRKRYLSSLTTATQPELTTCLLRSNPSRLLLRSLYVVTVYGQCDGDMLANHVDVLEQLLQEIEKPRTGSAIQSSGAVRETSDSAFKRLWTTARE